MNLTLTKRNITRAFLAVLALCGFVLPASANISGRWLTHSSSDLYSGGSGRVQKILDGERYTYFHTSMLAHDTQWALYGENFSSIQRYDKQNPQKGILPLSYEVDLSDSLVETISYCPIGKYLVIVYRSGIIDIVFDDGRLKTCNALKDYLLPGAKEPNLVLTDNDGKTFYLTTGFGYITVNAETGEARKIVSLGKSIDFAVRLGQRMLVCDGTNIYAFPVDNPPADLTGLTPLKASEWYVDKNFTNKNDTLNWPFYPIPSTDDSFYIFLPSSQTDKLSMPYLFNATFDDNGDLKLVSLGNTYMHYDLLNGYSRYRFRYPHDSLITPCKEGFFAGGYTDDRFVRLGVVPDFSDPDCEKNFKARAMSLIYATGLQDYRPGTTTVPSYKFSSYDNETFWFYYLGKGFMRARYDYDAKSFTMIDTEPMLPNAPSAMLCTAMQYDPHYGLLVRNFGECESYSAHPYQSDGLCAYRDGKWTQYGLAATNNAEFSRNSMPRGIGIDPLAPQYVWGGSRDNGLLRINMTDPTDILHISRSNHASRNKPGFVSDHDYCPAWGSLSCFSSVKFDSYGTMWTLFTDWNEYGKSQTHTYLRYLSADDRAASENASKDPSLYIPPGKIKVPISNMSTNLEVWTFNNFEGNKNLVGVTPNAYYEAFILNHNGTPDDTSDDKIAYLTDIYDRSNTKLELLHPSYMFDDPYDGTIWVSYYDGILLLKADELFDNDRGTYYGDMLIVENDLSGFNGRTIAQCAVTGIAVDNLGRKWIATQSEGLYCLSADRKSLLAHFTKANSPLTTDGCLSVGFNPETRTVWVGTDHGIMEFMPDGATESPYSALRVNVAPKVITPEFKGYVKITGLSDFDTYTVFDGRNNRYADITPEQGVIEIDSSMLETNEYTVKDKEGKTLTTFTVL